MEKNWSKLSAKVMEYLDLMSYVRPVYDNFLDLSKIPDGKDCLRKIFFRHDIYLTPIVPLNEEELKLLAGRIEPPGLSNRKIREIAVAILGRESETVNTEIIEIEFEVIFYIERSTCKKEIIPVHEDLDELKESLGYSFKIDQPTILEKEKITDKVFRGIYVIKLLKKYEDFEAMNIKSGKKKVKKTK